MDNIKKFLAMGADGEAVRRLIQDAIQLTQAQNLACEVPSYIQECFEIHLEYLAELLVSIAEGQ